MYEHAKDAVNSYFLAHPSVGERSATGFLSYCQTSQNYSDVFVCDGYRLCRAAKLLMALGYGNFDTIIQYDIYALSEAYFAETSSWNVDDFQDSLFSIDFSTSDVSSILNSPNLSILPLLAYHKICNDHYRNEKWQPFEPWTCNIDYLSPTDNMNANSFIASSTFTSLSSCLIDLENSNLPIDYFTSVLPRAQYGAESAVSIGLNHADEIGRAHV